MSAVALQSFGFGEQLVRVFDRAGGVWFVANDVCAALEITNPRNVLARLEDDERDDVHTMDAIGRLQKTAIISESGLYSLIFGSRKPIAIQFRKWVTSEVLPAIRTTGRFELPANDDDDMVPSELTAPDEFERYRLGLQLVKEARITFGAGAARRAWTIAGLPDLSPEPIALPAPSMIVSEVNKSVAEWMDARCEHVPGHRVAVSDLYDDYLTWCRAEDRAAQSLPGFGRYLANCGLEKVKSNRMQRVGLRLKAQCE
jgi:prophage antirepressor-like protein